MKNKLLLGLVAILALGMIVIGCDNDGDGGNTDPKSITITGIDSGLNGKTFGVVLSSVLMDESSAVAAGTGTVSSGSVTIALKDAIWEDDDLSIGTDPFTGSGSYFAMLNNDVSSDSDIMYFYTDGKKTTSDFGFTETELETLNTQAQAAGTEEGAMAVYVNAMTSKVPKLGVSSATTSVAYNKFVDMNTLSAMFNGGESNDYYDKTKKEVYLRAASWTPGSDGDPGKNWNSGTGIKLSDVTFDGDALEASTQYKITIKGTTDKPFAGLGVMFWDCTSGSNDTNLAEWYPDYESSPVSTAGQFEITITRTTIETLTTTALDKIVVEVSTSEENNDADGTVMATISNFSMSIKKIVPAIETLEFTDVQLEKLTFTPHETYGALGLSVPSFSNYTESQTLTDNHGGDATGSVENGKFSFSIGTPTNGLDTMYGEDGEFGCECEEDAKYHDPDNDHGFLDWLFVIWTPYADVNASDPTAKGKTIYGFDTNGGRVYKGNSSTTINGNNITVVNEDVIYMYVDKDVTITAEEATQEAHGDNPFATTYTALNLELKAGWNMVKRTTTVNVDTGNNPPETMTGSATCTWSVGDSVRWIFESNED